MLNQNKLIHLPHLEEVPICFGTSGVDYLKSLLDSLIKKSKVYIKIKMDGSPSIIVGYVDDRFFVSTKSLFNKNPKLNFTNDDIKKNHPDSVDLQNKLYYALTYLSSTIPNNGNYYQGDLLFTEPDLQKVKISDQEYIIFKPNTIVYGVSENDISIDHKIGIVFHTSYKSEANINNLQADYNPDLSVLKQSKQVFMYDNDLQLDHIKFDFNILKSTLNSLNSINVDFDLIKDNSEDILKFFNNRVKIDSDLKAESNILFNDLISFSSDSFFKNNKSKIIAVLNLHKTLIDCKESILKSCLKSINDDIKMWFKLDSEYQETNPEGVVLITSDGVIKLIDRENFSKNNFNLEKNWR